MKLQFAAALAAFCISASAQAVVVDLSELPTSMQTCFSYGGTCWGASLVSPPMPGATASLLSTYDTPDMSAFQYMDGSTDKWLIRYHLTSPSSQGGTALAGNVWLSANQAYDLSNSTHGFTLFTEKVSPTPWNGGVMGDLTHQITLTTASLFAGGDTIQAGLDGSNNTYQNGTLNYTGGFLPCVAEGCSISAAFNLIGLTYLNAGSLAYLTFNPADTRGLLFRQASSYSSGYDNSFDYQQQLYVQPVPLPAGFWLLISGLAGFGAVASKRRA